MAKANEAGLGNQNLYPRPGRTGTGTGLGRRPVSASSACRDFWPCRTLTDGAGGFLPVVPVECLGIWDCHL
jgi:hypothetical protein